jgi:hypothetical protein
MLYTGLNTLDFLSKVGEARNVVTFSFSENLFAYPGGGSGFTDALTLMLVI